MSDMVGNPEDRLSRIAAHFIKLTRLGDIDFFLVHIKLSER